MPPPQEERTTSSWWMNLPRKSRNHLYLYIQRLRATDHLDEEQISEFMSFCYQQVFALRHHILQGNSE